MAARVRVGSSWIHARIVNLSSRGMMLQSEWTPTRGNYLEVRRGRHVVVARVIWSDDHRFGIQTQGRVCADALIRDVDVASPKGVATCVADDRRMAPRRDCKHDANRMRARAMEFGTFSVAGVGFAMLMFSAVSGLLGTPVSAIKTAFAATRSH